MTTPWTHWTESLGRPALVGMVHLAPLPGAPEWGGSMDRVLDRAADDAEALVEGGVDALLVENYGDTPFHAERVEPVTVAAMTRAMERIGAVSDLPLGVNVLRNDALAALSIAAATGAAFIRINVHTGEMLSDQGRITGRAAETLRERARLGAEVAILADLWVKHAVPPPGATLVDTARDCRERGGADALVLSGTGTGRPTDLGRWGELREALPQTPLWVGSGVDAESAARIAARVDGAIVGSAFRRDGKAGGEVERGRVERLVAAWHRGCAG